MCLVLIGSKVLNNPNHNINTNSNEGNHLKKKELNDKKNLYTKPVELALNQNKSKKKLNREESNTKNYPSDYDKETNQENWDNGSYKHLENFDIKCDDDQAFNGLKLVHKNDTVYYKFKCIRHLSLLNSTTEDKTTPPNSLLKNTFINSLSTQKLECSKGFGLQEFKLNENNGEIYFSFKCIKASSINGCSESKSPEKILNGKESLSNISFLDDLPISIQQTQIFSWLKFNLVNTNGVQSFFYTYGYCDLTDLVAQSLNEARKAKDFADFQASDLERVKSLYDTKLIEKLEAEKVFNRISKELSEILIKVNNLTVLTREAATVAEEKSKRSSLLQQTENEIKASMDGFYNRFTLNLLLVIVGLFLM
jgi:hypothetical protein